MFTYLSLKAVYGKECRVFYEKSVKGKISVEDGKLSWAELLCLESCEPGRELCSISYQTTYEEVCQPAQDRPCVYTKVTFKELNYIINILTRSNQD